MRCFIYGLSYKETTLIFIEKIKTERWVCNSSLGFFTQKNKIFLSFSDHFLYERHPFVAGYFFSQV